MSLAQGVDDDDDNDIENALLVDPQAPRPVEEGRWAAWGVAWFSNRDYQPLHNLEGEDGTPTSRPASVC